MTGASPESLPVSVPPVPPAAVALPESSPSVSEVPGQQQQQQPQVSAAVTPSVSRQQKGLGQQHVFVSMLAAREDIGM